MRLQGYDGALWRSSGQQRACMRHHGFLSDMERHGAASAGGPAAAWFKQPKPRPAPRLAHLPTPRDLAHSCAHARPQGRGTPPRCQSPAHAGAAGQTAASGPPGAAWWQRRQCTRPLSAHPAHALQSDRELTACSHHPQDDCSCRGRGAQRHLVKRAEHPDGGRRQEGTAWLLQQAHRLLTKSAPWR